MRKSIANCCNSLNWVPLLTPALIKDSCKIDHKLLNNRIKIAVVIAFASLGAAVFFSSSLAAAAILFSTCVVISLDRWKTERAADRVAVNDYLGKEYYRSESTSLRIQNSFNAAQLLVKENEKILANKKDGILDEKDNNMERLLEHTPNLKVFKLLVDSGADITLRDNHNISYFQRAVENEDTAFLEYVLSKKIVDPSKFTNDKIVELWLNIGSAKTGKLLKDYGFDVNVKGDNGQTPLERLVLESNFRVTQEMDYIPISEHMEILVKCGANLEDVRLFWTPEMALPFWMDPKVAETLAKLFQERS